MLSYNSYRLGGPWEYEMFTEVLTSTRYPDKKKLSMTHSNAPLQMTRIREYNSTLARLIDTAARNFLQRIEAQGWEPVDAFDADSLWAKGRVRVEDKSCCQDGAGDTKEIELTTVSILCRRWVKFRHTQVTTQSESTTLTLPIQGRSSS